MNKTPAHVMGIPACYTDAFGNEIGDSIDLQPCNYELDSTEKEEYIFTDEFYFTYYGEDGFTAYDN